MPTVSTAPFTACATSKQSSPSQSTTASDSPTGKVNEATGVEDGKLRLQVLISELDHAGYQSAARCLADDLDALVVHLRYPVRHRRRWRSTNLLERSLGEVKHRTKVMGRFPGETSCLTLVWAVLDLLITHQTNDINFNALDRQRLNRARYEGTEDTIPQEVTAA
ncbi:MAG TPA: transposase [Solirubrobacteraceae bacterium]